MEERMATLVAEAELNRAHLESSAGILGQQQQLEEAARKQVCYSVGRHRLTHLVPCHQQPPCLNLRHCCPPQLNQQRLLDLLCTKQPKRF